VSDVTVRMQSKSVTSNFTLSEGGTCSISQHLIRSLALEVCVFAYTHLCGCVCAGEAVRSIKILCARFLHACLRMLFVRKIDQWGIMCFHVIWLICRFYDLLFMWSSKSVIDLPIALQWVFLQIQALHVCLPHLLEQFAQ